MPGLYRFVRCGAGPGAPSLFPLSRLLPVDTRDEPPRDEPPREGRALFIRPGVFTFAMGDLGGIMRDMCGEAWRRDRVSVVLEVESSLGRGASSARRRLCCKQLLWCAIAFLAVTINRTININKTYE